MSILLVACSTQDDIINERPNDKDSLQLHTCKMIFSGSKSEYNDTSQSRGVEDWSDGDRIRLCFSAGISYGDAIYNNGVWTLNYYGTLTTGTTTKKCKAVYFDNPELEGGSLVRLTENTGIYEDNNGSYFFDDGMLTVMANLKPKTGRIRFAGSNNEKITIHGITHYTSYDCLTGTFTSSKAPLKSKISSDFTSYIYGEFLDIKQPRINLMTESSAYTRLLPTSIFKSGESGYLTIPSESNSNGWNNYVTFKVNDIEFNMIPVAYSNGNFLLAETETTEQLYNAVMGSNITSSQVPKSGLSWSEWQTFISRISSITNLNFRMPTQSEWEFAAKGGVKSKGYTYSGSNTISNVAWYRGNSNYSVHQVRQLQANELGFYDMSGNLRECTSTANTDNNNYYYWGGGSYEDYNSECTVESFQFYKFSESYNKGGLRLALSNN